MNKDPTNDPLELVNQVMHRVRAQHRSTLREHCTLTPMEARVLGFFGRQPGATLKDLAEHSGRDKAQLARLIKGLREQGWLKGEADAEDRRNQCLTLTPRGEAEHQRLRGVMQGMAAQAVRGLGAAERRTLCELLVRLRDNLDEPGR